MSVDIRSINGHLLADEKAREDIDRLSEEINPLQTYGWNDGYINKYGVIADGAGVRFHSNLLLCPPGVEVMYVAETNNANVFGISFYDLNGNFISGVANNGENGTDATVTSPLNAVYCRLSTRSEILNNTYYRPSTPVLHDFVNRIANVEEKYNTYIPFNTTGINRANAISIDGLLEANVIDPDYQITLYYLDDNDATQNIGWKTKIVLTDYKRPTQLTIRRTDNAVMAPYTANEAVIGLSLNKAAAIVDISRLNHEAYVDGAAGSDENNGYGRITAFATIQKAIDEGFKKILVKEGTYTEGISLSNLTGVCIMLDKAHSTFNAETSNTNPKIIIDCADNLSCGVSISKCSDCVFEDIEVANSTGNGWEINRCENLRVANCAAHDCATGGFEVNYTNGDFVNCAAYNIGVMGGGEYHDGFNIHGNGTTNFIDCFAHTCEDDGISHHDACHGYIFGGEYYNCGKGGVASPTHGATVDVIGVYSHDNVYGIYAVSTQGKSKGIIKDCILKNNTLDIQVVNTDVKLLKNIYDTKQVDAVSTVVEIN